MAELDGKATHKDFITPFDAHEQVVREQHEFKDGAYVKADPVHTLGENGPVPLHEYPKAVAHDEKGEPVIAKDVDHEAELTKGKE